jgi:hypothetical protein
MRLMQEIVGQNWAPEIPNYKEARAWLPSLA